MTVKEWLKRSNNMSNEIEQLEEKVSFERSKAMIMSPSFSNEVHGSADPHAKFDNVVYWEEKLARKREHLEAIEREIYEAIESIDGTTKKDSDCRKVLISLYVKHEGWKGAAKSIDRTVRQAQRVHGYGISILEMSQHVASKL